MNDSSRVIRQPGAVPPPARRAAVIIAAAALALLAAACEGSPSSSGSGGGSSNASEPANSHELAYSRCVRSHGVPNFPDPNSSGGFSKTTLQQLAASNSEYQTATQTCAHLLPAPGGPTQAQLRQGWIGMANFARCMRSRGMANWPDPTPYPPEPDRPTFNLPASIQPTPATIARMDICLRLVPNNNVVGHIDNDSWRSAQQAMAGS
jgi:hypothetical protein